MIHFFNLNKNIEKLKIFVVYKPKSSKIKENGYKFQETLNFSLKILLLKK